jgi:methyl-accepting chemotaxis protein
MKKGLRRTKYLVHPSSQLKYIEMTILPAILMSILCSYFLIRTGEVFLAKEKAQVAVEVLYLNDTAESLDTESYPPNVLRKMEVLKKRLDILKQNLEIEYLDTIKQWSTTRALLFIFLTIVVILAGLISLVLSHRIAGPIFRLKLLVDALAEGKDVPPIKFRNSDEFKELAESCEKLRNILKSKGAIK